MTEPTHPNLCLPTTSDGRRGRMDAEPLVPSSHVVATATIWRDLCYLVGLWLPMALLDVAVLSVWATLLTGVTLPFWYWAPRGTDLAGYVYGSIVHGIALGYFPHGPAGPGAAGLYADTLPTAMLAAAIFGLLFLLFNYVLVKAALTHAAIARAWLARLAVRQPGSS